MNEGYIIPLQSCKVKMIQLNGQELKLIADDALPAINGKAIKKGTIKLPPASITFISFTNEGK